MSSSEEWTWEEWQRRAASSLEDARILRAEIADIRANADMLRERGHPIPAHELEKVALESEALANHIETTINTALDAAEAAE